MVIASGIVEYELVVGFQCFVLETRESGMPLPASLELPNLRNPGARQIKAGPGRPPGLVNKITRDLKVGLIDAAVVHGFDGASLDGLPGFCRHLAARHPKAFAQLLGKLLPLNISADSTVNVIGAVNVVSVPSDRYVTAEDIRKMQPPPEVEHEPIEAVPVDDQDLDPMSKPEIDIDDEAAKAAGMVGPLAPPNCSLIPKPRVHIKTALRTGLLKAPRNCWRIAVRSSSSPPSLRRTVDVTTAPPGSPAR